METGAPTRPPHRPQEPAPDLSQEALAWFARLRSSRVTPDERAQFEAWRRRSPEHEHAFQDAAALWETPELMGAAIELDQEARRRPAPSWFQAHSPWVRPLAAAAVVLLVLVAIARQVELPLRLQADYVTVTGERHAMTLADRSTVTLNTDSAIATVFRGDARQVRLLKGEALFRVQPDQSRPFLVDHRGIVARAVGTAFAVRERREGVQVTVVEGIVAVQPAAGDGPSVRLTAGQQVLIGTGGAGPVQTVNPEVDLAWVHGRLVFDNAPFSEVVAEVARYHTGYIGLWNPALARLRVSGTYNLANPSQILTTLAQTLPLHMTRLTDRFIVFR